MNSIGLSVRIKNYGREKILGILYSKHLVWTRWTSVAQALLPVRFAFEYVARRTAKSGCATVKVVCYKPV
jgi:hypothetical protein